MDRAGLEALSRDDLIARAEELGVRRARIMTRPELIDEILLSSFGREAQDRDKKKLDRARGFFGRARDLLARVVEQGLHLPDTAERIRAVPLPPPHVERTAPSVLPTVTLAEIYAAQGHTARALDTLARVLAAEPDHAAARFMVEKLKSEQYAAPPVPDLGPEDAPAASAAEDAEGGDGVLGVEQVEGAAASLEPATRAATEVTIADAADACTAIPSERGELLIRWSVSRRMRVHHGGRRPSGALALRVATILATPDGPRASVRDEPIKEGERERALPALREVGLRRVAIGWLDGLDFVAIAHAPDLVRVAGGGLARWTPRGLRPAEIEQRAVG